MDLKDSGSRREFESGAVRDCNDSKGRCDLLPLKVIGLGTDDRVLYAIGEYIYTHNCTLLWTVIQDFSIERYGDIHTAMLEVSKHFADGARKYSDRNWEKGIPLHCYIDSGVRHYLKYLRGDTDEPHDRAFLWNMLCAIWTQENRPEMIDLPFKEDDK